MAVVERTVAATPDRIWAVLADGWTYSDWVVGTAHIREVDTGWPAPGTRMHHKAGPWPVSIHRRNRESLRRLADLAERRTDDRTASPDL